MKKEALLGIVLFGLLLTACSSSTETETLPENNSLPAGTVSAQDNITVENPETATAPTACISGWKCISANIRAFQLDNCTITEKKTCTLGCSNNTCRTAVPCTIGFKCRNSFTRGYQSEYCTWALEKTCEFGCKNAECQNATVEDKAATTTTPEKPTPAPSPRLSMGEVTVVTVNGQEHNLSLYFLEESRAKIAVDGLRSDWLLEGQNFTFSNGVKIKVTGILFQGFAGGTRAVEYSID